MWFGSAGGPTPAPLPLWAPSVGFRDSNAKTIVRAGDLNHDGFARVAALMYTDRGLRRTQSAGILDLGADR